MVKLINTWTQGIVIVVIISTIIEMILPEGSIKKYIKVVMGTYIVFVIISPIITKISGKEINLDKYELPENKTYKEISINTNTYIENTYINNIKQEIIKNIEEKGYEVKNIEVEIDKEEENYGNINKINIRLKEKANTGVNAIETIDVNINNDKKEIEKIPENDLNDLKEFLQKNYGTKIENINIE